jgi:DUF971 family protein
VRQIGETAGVEQQYGTPEPVDVEVDREHGVTLVWPDGHTSHYRLPELRAGCPCAECRNVRLTGGPSWSAPPGTADQLRVAGAEFAGSYGLQLRWNDGHETGIFSWELLRRWCGCPRCVPEEP